MWIHSHCIIFQVHSILYALQTKQILKLRRATSLQKSPTETGRIIGCKLILEFSSRSVCYPTQFERRISSKSIAFRRDIGKYRHLQIIHKSFSGIRFQIKSGIYRFLAGTTVQINMEMHIPCAYLLTGSSYYLEHRQDKHLLSLQAVGQSNGTDTFSSFIPTSTEFPFV